MQELIAKIKTDIDALLSEIDKTENGAAKRRTRGRSLDLEKHLKQYRKESLK